MSQLTQRRAAGGMGFTLCIPELEIHSGELIAFVGESGCGKSTLLDLLGLIATPASAQCFTLTLGDQSVDLMKAGDTIRAGLRRKHLGYVLQRGGLLPFLTAGDNVALACRLNGERHPKDRVNTLLEALGILEHRDKKPALLSGGQRQRLAIARALAHQPEVLLADEPTGSVDKLTAREIRDQLRMAAQSLGTTVLIVSHDEALLAGTTDRVFTFDVRRTGENQVTSTLSETTWEHRAQTSA